MYLLKSHTNLAVVNSRAFTDAALLETAHPFVSEKGATPTTPSILVISASVSRPGCLGFLLVFDQQTAFSDIDTVYIYESDAMKTLYFKNSGLNNWPGVDKSKPCSLLL